MKTTLCTVVVILSLSLSACVYGEPEPAKAPGDNSAAPTSRPSQPNATRDVAKSTSSSQPTNNSTFRTRAMTADELPKSADDWRKVLSSDEFYVLREKGTERQYAGYWNNKKTGSYYCAGCGEHLFESGTKFESGSGWPSFYKPAAESSVETESDVSAGMTRTEVHCKNCKGHLGHVFDDGPNPTGLRYCVNSISLKFKEQAKK